MKPTEIQLLRQEIEALKVIINSLKKTIVQEVWLDSADLKLQFNFSESKLYRLRKANKIPNEKIGGTYYYPKSYFTQVLIQRINDRNDSQE